MTDPGTAGSNVEKPAKFSHLDSGDLVKFLAGLKTNNNKAWFEARRSEFERLREQFFNVLDDVILASGPSFAPEISDTDPRKCMFLILPHTRFSADKSPYKTNFRSLAARDKGKDVRAGYYIHIGADDRLMAGARVSQLPSK